MSHNMILNCFNINYFFLDFGNGYCVEMPSDKKDLDKLLDYLFSQKVEWKFYATLTGRKWFHGIYITFKNRKHLEVTSIMKDICMILKIDSYGLCENYTQSIIDIEGDVIAFADFSEKQE